MNLWSLSIYFRASLRAAEEVRPWGCGGLRQKSIHAHVDNEKVQFYSGTPNAANVANAANAAINRGGGPCKVLSVFTYTL